MPGLMFSNLPNEFEVIRKDLFSVQFPVSMNIPEQFILSAARPMNNNPRKEIPFKNLTSVSKTCTMAKTTYRLCNR
jgi:hypothetical protein